MKNNHSWVRYVSSEKPLILTKQKPVNPKHLRLWTSETKGKLNWWTPSQNICYENFETIVSSDETVWFIMIKCVHHAFKTTVVSKKHNCIPTTPCTWSLLISSGGWSFKLRAIVANLECFYSSRLAICENFCSCFLKEKNCSTTWEILKVINLKEESSHAFFCDVVRTPWTTHKTLQRNLLTHNRFSVDDVISKFWKKFLLNFFVGFSNLFSTFGLIGFDSRQK